VVERLYPNMARAKTWLDVHGMDLHRYGEQGSAAASPPSDEADI
jgi:hypothetical protein